MVPESKPELLVLDRAQFGYHLGTYYCCMLGASHFKITHVSFDIGRPKFCLKGGETKYVPHKGSRLLRYLRLLAACTREARKCGGAIFIKYFPGCSILRYLSGRKRVIVDIRTGSVHPNPLVRRGADWLMRWECSFFPETTVISEGLAKRLHLPSGKTHILPLGAGCMGLKAKRFDRLDLLYVGTLDGRRIEDTLIGFERFLRDGGSGIDLTYTIVGKGHNGELDRLRRIVHMKGLDNIVSLPGYVHKTELQSTFERCNVGVSYVPITDIYDCQPVTKTFEYIFAGMPVIATATTENRKVVDRLNGVLIGDTPEDFYRGLKEVFDRRHEFDSEKIRCCCPDASWDRIVNFNFVPYVHNICQS